MVRPSVGVPPPPGGRFSFPSDLSRARNILLCRFGLCSLRTCLSMRHSERPQAALGKAIRALRDERELTQETLAERTGLTGRTLSGIETGAANPTWATVHDIAAALGVSIREVAKLAESYEERGCRSRK